MGNKLLGVVRADLINDIQEVRTLSSPEYEQYKKAIFAIKRIGNNLGLFKTVYSNFKEYQVTLDHYLKQYAETPVINPDLMDEMILQLNRLISNYLCSVKLLLDHSTYDLITEYGKKSQYVNDFQDICSEAYDTSFSYRFLSKLRNYVQHCGMPIGHLNLQSSVDEIDPHKSNVKLELKFNRDDLLNKFNWKKLTNEIQNLPPDFDINPHINNMNEWIGKIIFSLIQNELPNAVKASNYLQKLIEETDKFEGVTCILDASNMTNCGGNLTIEHFPFHLIEQVNKLTNESTKTHIEPNQAIEEVKTPSVTIIVDKTDIKKNLNKGINGELYYIPEDHQLCPKCNGSYGFYYRNEVDILGKRYTSQYFGCLKCKGIIK